MPETVYSKAQLATILSALDGQLRHPAAKEKALAAIARSAATLGLSADEVLAAAPGLLDGRLDPAAWRAELTDTADPSLAMPAPAGPAGDDATGAADATTDNDPAQAETANQAMAAAPANEDQAPVAAAEPAARRTPRAGSKQAQLIAMLQRPEGADLDAIVEATGWQKHTVRGAISGALKKRLGLTVTSTRDEQGRRVYHIA